MAILQERIGIVEDIERMAMHACLFPKSSILVD